MATLITSKHLQISFQCMFSPEAAHGEKLKILIRKKPAPAPARLGSSGRCLLFEKTRMPRILHFLLLFIIIIFWWRGFYIF